MLVFTLPQSVDENDPDILLLVAVSVILYIEGGNLSPCSFSSYATCHDVRPQDFAVHFQVPSTHIGFAIRRSHLRVEEELGVWEGR